MEGDRNVNKNVLWMGLLAIAAGTLCASPALAGSSQLVAPIVSMKDMILGAVVNIATLALILGLIAKIWAAHLLGGLETVVNKAILIGLIAQVPRLVGMMGVSGGLVP
jgi:hypothetical protein